MSNQQIVSYVAYAGRRIVIDKEGKPRMKYHFQAVGDSGAPVDFGYYFDSDQSRLFAPIRLGDILKLHEAVSSDSPIDLNGYRKTGRTLLLRGATPDDERSAALCALWMMEDRAAASFGSMQMAPAQRGALYNAVGIVADALASIPREQRLRMLVLLFESVLSR